MFAGIGLPKSTVVEVSEDSATVPERLHFSDSWRSGLL